MIVAALDFLLISAASPKLDALLSVAIF